MMKLARIAVQSVWNDIENSNIHNFEVLFVRHSSCLDLIS